jgi:hypothetical protein
MVLLEGLGQLKNPLTSLGIKPTIFWLVAQCLNQLRKRMTPLHVYYTEFELKKNSY